MLRKSVETRDWLHTIEPRTVRAVMKRVVEDITAIDVTVALLYDDHGNATEHSSDSSRKTHRYGIYIDNVENLVNSACSISVSRHQYRSNWSSYTPSHLDSTLVSNMHKLFSERIEIFSAVEFNKVSILTGIIKISLKVPHFIRFFLSIIIDFYFRLLWNVLGLKRLANMVYNKFRWTHTTYNCIYGGLSLTKSRLTIFNTRIKYFEKFVSIVT